MSEVDVRGLSIQERLYPGLQCFGCGHPKGLMLRSYPGEGAVVATFRPWPEHDNGLGFLNGGIISTVLDCHSAAAVMLQAESRGLAPLAGAAMSYVTAELDVRYLRPSPLHEASDLSAVVTSAAESEMTVQVELVHGGTTRAVATAVWKRWRPR